MKSKVTKFLEKCRVKKGPSASNTSDGFNGHFIIPYKKKHLYVICSDCLGWDHVSVSLKDRVPTWYEMKFIKECFWDDDEIVVQFHPPESDYINSYPHVLHLWKKQGHEFELPPQILV